MAGPRSAQGWARPANVGERVFEPDTIAGHVKHSPCRPAPGPDGAAEDVLPLVVTGAEGADLASPCGDRPLPATSPDPARQVRLHLRPLIVGQVMSIMHTHRVSTEPDPMESRDTP
jgi:hypothetical protein